MDEAIISFDKSRDAAHRLGTSESVTDKRPSDPNTGKSTETLELRCTKEIASLQCSHDGIA